MALNALAIDIKLPALQEIGSALRVQVGSACKPYT
jgi:hypothetical protein